MCVFVCVCVCVRACVRVCVRERESGRTVNILTPKRSNTILFSQNSIPSFENSVDPDQLTFD